MPERYSLPLPNLNPCFDYSFICVLTQMNSEQFQNSKAKEDAQTPQALVEELLQGALDNGTLEKAVSTAPEVGPLPSPSCPSESLEMLEEEIKTLLEKCLEIGILSLDHTVRLRNLFYTYYKALFQVDAGRSKHIPFVSDAQMFKQVLQGSQECKVFKEVLVMVRDSFEKATEYGPRKKDLAASSSSIHSNSHSETIHSSTNSHQLEQVEEILTLSPTKLSKLGQEARIGSEIEEELQRKERESDLKASRKCIFTRRL